MKTVKEILDAKINLESHITEYVASMVRNFEQETGAKVSMVHQSLSTNKFRMSVTLDWDATLESMDE